jgi:NAD dependent epimerase/dehydratase family enzyme
MDELVASGRLGGDCQVFDDKSANFWPVNLASPGPVTNAQFMKAMRKEFAPLGIGFPAPTPAILAGSVIIGTDSTLILKSLKVVSRILSQHNYPFKFPKITEALNSLK